MSTAALRMQSFLLRVHVLTSSEFTTQARSLHAHAALFANRAQMQACRASGVHAVRLVDVGCRATHVKALLRVYHIVQ